MPKDGELNLTQSQLAKGSGLPLGPGPFTRFGHGRFDDKINTLDHTPARPPLWLQALIFVLEKPLAVAVAVFILLFAPLF
ncbi:MAG: hypothetical protein ABJQ85_07800 [Rhizobiaceae bacterium]